MYFLFILLLCPNIDFQCSTSRSVVALLLEFLSYYKYFFFPIAYSPPPHPYQSLIQKRFLTPSLCISASIEQNALKGLYWRFQTNDVILLAVNLPSGDLNILRLNGGQRLPLSRLAQPPNENSGLLCGLKCVNEVHQSHFTPGHILHRKQWALLPSFFFFFSPAMKVLGLMHNVRIRPCMAENQAYCHVQVLPIEMNGCVQIYVNIRMYRVWAYSANAEFLCSGNMPHAMRMCT